MERGLRVIQRYQEHGEGTRWNLESTILIALSVCSSVCRSSDSGFQDLSVVHVRFRATIIVVNAASNPSPLQFIPEISKLPRMPVRGVELSFSLIASISGGLWSRVRFSKVAPFWNSVKEISKLPRMPVQGVELSFSLIASISGGLCRRVRFLRAAPFWNSVKDFVHLHHWLSFHSRCFINRLHIFPLKLLYFGIPREQEGSAIIVLCVDQIDQTHCSFSWFFFLALSGGSCFSGCLLNSHVLNVAIRFLGMICSCASVDKRSI